MDELGLPLSHNVNSFLYDTHPAMFERIRKRGDEIIGHGRTNGERQSSIWEEDEARLINDATSAITRHEGKPPKGWLGPWLAETHFTPDLLKEAGYRYVMDWACDDQPIWMNTRSGKILSVPYSLEINDSPAMVFRHHTARQFADMIVDQFEEMVEQCEEQPLVCSVVLHTFVAASRSGCARCAARCHIMEHRDRLWITTPGEIAGAERPAQKAPCRGRERHPERLRRQNLADSRPGRHDLLRQRLKERAEWRNPVGTWCN